MPTRRPTTAVALALGIALAFAACSDGGSSGDTTATALPPSGTPMATATLAPEPTPTPTTAPAATIVFDTFPGAEPPQIARTLGSPPDSMFPPWDGVSTVIYNVHRGTTLELGQGTFPAMFNPSESLAVFERTGINGVAPEVVLVELPSGQLRSLGGGRLQPPGFVDDQHILVRPASGPGPAEVLNIISGERARAGGEKTFLPYEHVKSAPEGYTAEPVGQSGSRIATFLVSTDAGKPVLTFDAVAATAAGPDELAVAAPPVAGRSSLYIVNVLTRQMTFIATAVPGEGAFPISATSDYVVWTDEYCRPQSTVVSLFNRRTGRLARIDVSAVSFMVADMLWMRLTPGDRLAAGSFGAKFLISAETLEYAVSIPSRPDGYGGDIWWSANYTYASRGPVGGHGGHCP